MKGTQLVVLSLITVLTVTSAALLASAAGHPFGWLAFGLFLLLIIGCFMAMALPNAVRRLLIVASALDVLFIVVAWWATARWPRDSDRSYFIWVCLIGPVLVAGGLVFVAASQLWRYRNSVEPRRRKPGVAPPKHDTWLD